jgi:hypothetical protein
MKFTSLNEDDNFLTYPANKIIGILNTRDDLRAALTDLNNSGCEKEQVQVLCGETGVDRLDHRRTARSFR